MRSIIVFLLFFAFSNWVSSQNNELLNFSFKRRFLSPDVCNPSFNKRGWLVGEAVPSPFAIQFYAVYSYGMLAYYIQSNLVLGPLFATTDLSSSEEPVRSNVSFGHFFDLEHYRNYWSSFNDTKVVTEEEYNACFPQNSAATFERIPQFLAINKRWILAMFQQFQGLRLPLTEGTAYRTRGEYKMTGLYDFWYDKNMFSHTYKSIKPSPAIATASQYVLKVLPKPFIALQMRFDDTAYGNSLSSASVKAITLKFVQSVNESFCFKNLLDEGSEIPTSFSSAENWPPAVYVITSVEFMNGNEKQRARKFFNYLRKTGVKVIATNKIYSDYALKNPSLSLENLSIEQLNYVDFLVAKQASCFIPSSVPSVLSYLIRRFRKFDRKILESYADVNENAYGSLAMYRDWGI
jgi:hypothetical protein